MARHVLQDIFTVHAWQLLLYCIQNYKLFRRQTWLEIISKSPQDNRVFFNFKVVQYSSINLNYN